MIFFINSFDIRSLQTPIKSSTDRCRPFRKKCLKFSNATNKPANIRLDEDVLKSSFIFVFRRRVDQDEYIRLTHTFSEDVLIKTYICLGDTPSRRLHDVLQKNVCKTSSRHLEGYLKMSCEEVFKRS